MNRDFSIAVEAEILEYAAYKEGEGEGYCIEFSNEEIEEYEYFGNDIEYHMNHIRLHHQYLVERNHYTREAVEKIFEDVREFDTEYAEATIYADKNNTLEPYKRTMKALLDSISGDCSSIFTDVNTFSSRMQMAGTGLLGEVYIALQQEEAFEALMAKPMEEIKPWEVVALSKLFDDCITVDGNCQVNDKELSALLERCYIQTACSEPISQHDVMLPGYVTYELAPVVELLVLYREFQTDRMVGVYMNPDTRRAAELSQEQMLAECYITDTIYGVKEYFAQVSLNSWDDSDYSQPHIVMDDSQVGKIVLSIANNSERNREKITIFGFTGNLTGESGQANSDAEKHTVLNTQKEVTTTMANIGISRLTKSIAGLVPGGGTVMNLYGWSKDFYSIYNAYQASEDYNSECYSKIRGLELQELSNILNCNGTVIRCGDEVSVRHLAIDETETTMDVVLYNEYHPDNRISVGQLERELTDVLSGKTEMEACVGIQALREFDRADEYDAQEHPLFNYNNFILLYLNKQYGLEYVDQATMEQLEEAAEYAAKKWREDPGEYER